MKCPFCHVDNDRVIDSRASNDGYTIRRRRECTHCHRRYTTYERIEEPQIKVVKKDGNCVPFEREKIRQGLERACWKRPVNSEQIEAIIAKVEADIRASYDTEVPTSALGSIVMHELRQVDPVAYVRFASVYRDFTDARDFVQEIGPMLEEFGDKDK